MAPEVVLSYEENGYSSKCDIWSMGICAIEMAEKSPPLFNLHPMNALLRIRRSEPPNLKYPSKWPPEFQDFISNCLKRVPDERPTAKQLITHSFITQRPESDDKQLIINMLKSIGIEALNSDTPIVSSSAQISTKQTVPTLSSSKLDTKQIPIKHVSLAETETSFKFPYTKTHKHDGVRRIITDRNVLNSSYFSSFDTPISDSLEYNKVFFHIHYLVCSSLYHQNFFKFLSPLTIFTFPNCLK